MNKKNKKDYILQKTVDLTGLQLKEQLHKMFSPLKLNDYNSLRYDDMRQVLFTKLKEKGLYGKHDMDSSSLNCEHVWPQSFFNKEYPMKSDINHCFMTHSRLNSHRNTYKFANIDDSKSQFLDQEGNKTDSQNENYSEKCNYDRSFEPIDISKGNIARAIAYFDTMYPLYDISKVIDISTLLEWNEQDPVDEDELIRVELSFQYQKNINPFIVCPELLRRCYTVTLEERLVALEKHVKLLMNERKNK